MKIIDSLETVDAWCKTYNAREQAFVKDCEASISMYGGEFNSSINIVDLRNAQSRGLVCNEFTLSGNSAALNDFKADMNYSLKTIINKLRKTADLLGDRIQTLKITDDLKLSIYRNKSINTYSPFSLEKIKPLTKLPKVLKKTDAIRVLANNQVTNIETDYHYTDDYAYDAAVNNKEGYAISNMILLRDIIESSANYHLSIKGNKMSFSPHSNHNLSGTICPELMNH